MGYCLCPEPFPVAKFVDKRPNEAAWASLRSLEVDVFFFRAAGG